MANISITVQVQNDTVVSTTVVQSQVLTAIKDSGPQGLQGPQGEPGSGATPGGTTGQVLRKATNTDFDSEWHTLVKSDVGLSNVDNTSDANKPVSTAQQTALDLKLTKNSPITGATKTKITYDANGLVTAGANANQDDIGDGTTNKQYSATDKTKLAGIEALADVTDAGNVGSSIHGATAKTTPVNADEIALIDTEAANVLKKVTLTNVKAFLKTYFDSLYQASLGFTAENIANKDTDGTLSANSDTKYPSQKAVKTYADQLIASNDAMVFKGVIDASSNPNYPAADRGDTYKISVAGKIGGASGINVEVGDLILCITDSTASGTQAGVGANWDIIQSNLDGAVIGPSSATDNAVARYDATSGRLIQNSGASIDDSGNISANNLSGTNTGDQTLPVKASGAEIDTGTDDAKFVTAKAVADSAIPNTTQKAGNQISGATGKTTPVDADYVGLMDSAASNILKKLSWANIKATLKTYFDTLYPSGSGNSTGTNTGDQTTVSGNAGSATVLQTSRNIDGQAFNGSADITVIAPGTHAATGKTTPVDADELPIVDSAASNVLKKLTWANLKATAKTYFDTLYSAIGTLTLTEAPSDQTATGIIVSLTYGESLVPGDAVYYKSDGKVWGADADGSSTYPCIGIALETASSGSHQVLLRGIYRDDARYNRTVGGLVFLSTTAKTLTQTAPSATDNVIQVVGVATHADRIYINPTLTYITHT